MAGTRDSAAPGPRARAAAAHPPDHDVHARCRALLDEVDQGVIETTPGGDVLLVNRAFAVKLGYESVDDLRAHVRAAGDLYVHDKERPAQVRRALDGSTEAIAIEVRRKDGNAMWVRARVTPAFTAEGELVSMRAVLEEVDERPLTQQSLQEASDAIEARERLLLAEAIHDDPLQLITAALLRLDSLQDQAPPGSGSALEQVASVLDQAMDRLRRLVETLHPPDLHAGPGVALQEYAQAIFIQDATGIEVRGPHEVPLPAPSTMAAYRIMREALVNARKHARARLIVISTEITPTAVVLSVQDDGVGTDTLTTTSGHMGLPTMRARAQALGAGLSVSSKAGQGTTVTLSVPLPRDEEPAAPS